MPIRKLENTHKSSSFQSLKDDIIRKYNLSRVCQDIDLLKLNCDRVESIIEVKAGKESNTQWKPYIKKYYPSRSSNKLDDINYEALFKFAGLLNVNLLLFRYEKNKLDNGISIYKIISDNQSLDFNHVGIYSLEKMIELSKGRASDKNFARSFDKVKDYSNPNIPIDQNLYHFFHNNSKLNGYYYVERDGIWTMLISNEVTLTPLWLYIELNFSLNLEFYCDQFNFKSEFFPVVEMARRLDIPLSIIAYDTELSFIDVFEFSLEQNDFIFIHQFCDEESFEKYYIKNIK